MEKHNNQKSWILGAVGSFVLSFLGALFYLKKLFLLSIKFPHLKSSCQIPLV